MIMRKELILFEEAKKSKRLFNGVVSTVVLLLMLFLGQIMGGIVIGFIMGMMNGAGIELSPLASHLGLLLMVAFPLPLCFLWVTKFEKRKISSLGLKKKNSLINFLKGFWIGLLMFGLVTGLMYVSGVITLEQGLSAGIKTIPGVLVILPGWILQSSTEEILTRGWFMHVVGARHKPVIGFVLSSVIFGFMHLLNPGVTALSIINIILVGLVLGLYVIHTQDLWGACGIHAAWNFSQSNVFGFNVSGMETSTHSLLRFSANGPDFLTGGAFGPEASIMATIITVLFIGILLFKLKSSYKEASR